MDEYSEYNREDAAALNERLPTWWCDDYQVLRDLVAVTLGELTDVVLEPISESMWFVEAEGYRCLVAVQDLDRGVEVSTALAYDVPVTQSSTKAVLGFNRDGSPARHWVSDNQMLMAAARVSARPFVGAHLFEAIEIVLGAAAESHHAAAACGGVPASKASGKNDRV
jgi:hypothetical protein